MDILFTTVKIQMIKQTILNDLSKKGWNYIEYILSLKIKMLILPNTFIVNHSYIKVCVCIYFKL